MKLFFATLLLAPVLLWQARRVRRDTLRLPEAEGARSGVAGEGELLRLLVTGDSAAAGVGAGTQAEALAGQLVAQLAARYHVQWTLQARSGHTLADTVALLQQMPAAEFDVVVTSIGVNNATAGTAGHLWQQQHRDLLILLSEKFGARHVLHSAVPPMQHFTGLPQPLRWYMGLRAARLNACLCTLLLENESAELVFANLPAQHGMLARDGFHPAPPAYRLWAQRLAHVIQRRLAAEKKRPA